MTMATSNMYVYVYVKLPDASDI